MNFTSKITPFTLTDIPTPLLSEIASEISSLISCRVAIADINGKIIASTDTSLIGIYTKNCEVISDSISCDGMLNEDSFFLPYRDKVSLLPISIDTTHIGIIYIIGEPKNGESNKLLQYLATRMIVDAYLQQDEMVLYEMKRGYIYNWLYNTATDDWHSFMMRGLALGIDISVDRLACLLKIKWIPADYLSSAHGTGTSKYKVEKVILSCINLKPENIAIGVGADYYIVLLNEKNPQKAKQLVEAVISVLERQYPCQVFAGISAGGRNSADIQYSFWEARTACKTSENRVHSSNVTLYSEYELSMLFANMNEKTKHVFFKTIYQNCSPADITQFMELLKAYMEHNGSISKIAESMHVHKNTIQYQLNRMEKLTGYDARNIKDFIPLAISFRFYEEGLFDK